jgi:hypothetical protein
VTHPFHPWCGREFVFVALRQTWGEDRVFFLAEDGTLKSLEGRRKSRFGFMQRARIPRIHG